MASFIIIFLLYTMTVFLHIDHGYGENRSTCPTEFPCGSLGMMKFPFSSNMSRPECGVLTLECEANPFPRIRIGGRYFYAYGKLGEYIRLYDPVLESIVLQRDRCNSFPTNISLPNFPNSPSVSLLIPHNFTVFKCSNDPNLTQQMNHMGYINHTMCAGFSLFYRLPGEGDAPPILPRHGVPAKCSPILLPYDKEYITSDLFGIVSVTFILEWLLSDACSDCQSRGGQCLTPTDNQFHCSDESAARKVDFRLLVRAVLGTVASVIAILLAIFIVMFSKRRNFIRTKTNDKQKLENFLKTYGSLAPKRYSYSEVRKMTESFRNQLGQGGYGCVYKGKMDDGSCVAVKVLKDLEGDGEGFINEVVSISRTSHVNIVTLKGFCFDGRKRALVYEFMSNGSLEKFIYESKSSTSRQLEWKVLYDIAIGIARGLEYLHRGCNIRILHFDIKPHNILLDEDFRPKISDFGLAKLCMNKESIISTFGARGTIGYIAPEFVCRSVGGVSYKSDVYSYGMMVLEMVGGRKNFDAGISRESEIYFPHWIHNRLELDEELELSGITTEEENEYARKMIIVSLWCIQMNPAFRPSMSRVVEMLEGNLSNLEIPPKPYFSSPSTSEVSHVCQSPNETSPFTSNLA